MNFIKKSKLALAIIMSTGVLLSGCGVLPKEEQAIAPPLVKPKKQEYHTYEVKKKDITRLVKGNGRLISTNESNVFTKENGRRIKSIKAQYGQTVKKGDVLVELDSDNTENEITIQQFNLQRAQINYDRAVQGNDEYGKKLANIEVQIEKTKLANLQKQLSSSKLISQVDGTVVFLDSLKEGDIVEPYKTLVTVADPKKLQVVYQSSDAASVTSGMRVDLNFNSKSYEGVVAQLPSSGKYKDSIIINFKEDLKDGKLGDGIELSITLETKSNTIVVPKQAVKNFMGSSNIEILDGDKKISVSVDKGIENATEVEILSGLEEGQKVIIN